MAKYKRKNGITSVLYYIFIFLLLVAVVGMFSSFVLKDNTSSKKSFYIDYNGERLSNKSTLSLQCNKDLEFAVDFLGDTQEYTVEVVPCNSFSYVVSGSTARYEKIITTFPKRFYCVDKTSSGFILRLEEFNILSILSDYHETNAITLPEGYDVFGSYYALSIRIDGVEEYKIPFSLVSPVESVELGGGIVI